MTKPTEQQAREALAVLIGYEPDEHDAEYEKAVDAYRAAVLDEAIKAVLGRVEAYEGMGQDAVDRNRERTAIAAMLRRMAEEART
ncbi:hypothetical protein [Streptomyces sp. NPDC004330]|uniref:hypothetical protein n=1 Tax=Streptomyces sp. NPDC004330 TaxID=3364700 RepID=UPI0036AECF06